MSSKNESEIRIRSLGKKVHDEIMNISDHTGISVSSLLKPKVVELINSYPEHMRKPKEDK